MTINLKYFYYFGFSVYLCSFLLPAFGPSNKDAFYGFMCAYYALNVLFSWPGGLLSFLINLFANLSNIFTIVCFVLQFKIALKKLFPLQLIAFLSASYWCLAVALEKGGPLGFLLIGYWLWLSSMLFMAIVMIQNFRLKKNG